jgi:hypothetical protein
MADTQALQGCIMLIACNESYPQAWLAAHCREVVVWERARALARELDRALSGHALERHCTILPTVTLLSEEGYAVHLFPGSATAARCLRDLATAAIILDVHLESRTAGWEVLADLRRDLVLHATPGLVCTADRSALQERTGELGRQECTILAKPFDVDP